MRRLITRWSVEVRKQLSELATCCLHVVIRSALRMPLISWWALAPSVDSRFRRLAFWSNAPTQYRTSYLSGSQRFFHNMPRLRRLAGTTPAFLRAFGVRSKGLLIG